MSVPIAGYKILRLTFTGPGDADGDFTSLFAVDVSGGVAIGVADVGGGATGVVILSEEIAVSYFDIFVGGATTALSASATDLFAGESDCNGASLRASFAGVDGGSVFPCGAFN